MFKRIEKAVKSLFIKILSKFINAQEDAVIPPLKKVKSVLVIRPDRLGDFILSVPAINSLSRAMPKSAKLTVLAGTRGKDIARLFFGDNIIIFNKNILSFIKVALVLMAGKYDIVINLHSYPFSMTSALFTLASGSEIRIGFTETGESKNPLAGKIFNKGIKLLDNKKHEVDKNLLLVKKAGVKKLSRSFPDFKLPAEKVRAAAKEMKAYSKGREIIGLHPSLIKKDNRWDAENYVELGHAINNSKKTWAVAFYGAGEEKEIWKFISRSKEGIQVFGENNILSIMAAASLCSVFVCGDSGIMHAVSLVAKQVVLWGPSILSRWRPAGNKKAIILKGANGNCNSIAVKRVFAVVKKNLKK